LICLHTDEKKNTKIMENKLLEFHSDFRGKNKKVKNKDKKDKMK